MYTILLAILRHLRLSAIPVKTIGRTSNLWKLASYSSKKGIIKDVKQTDEFTVDKYLLCVFVLISQAAMKKNVL